MGAEGPPSLSEFYLRAELWKRLGMRMEEFRELPWRTAQEYLIYLQLIIQEENNQAREARRGGSRR